MTFGEWFKDNIPKEGLSENTTFSRQFVKDAFEAGQAELKMQIKRMKEELHHRLVSPSKGDSDCLEKIIGLDRLWQFGEEF